MFLIITNLHYTKLYKTITCLLSYLVYNMIYLIRIISTNIIKLIKINIVETSTFHVEHKNNNEIIYTITITLTILTF